MLQLHFRRQITVRLGHKTLGQIVCVTAPNENELTFIGKRYVSVLTSQERG